ncbi:MAG: carbohydrate ABC transporter permease [Clostridia bacterium]|nr:carbohydrate ABC transporter permease [Clostridia bacterium]
MKIKKTASDIVIDFVCYATVILLCVTVVVPFWNLFSTSITPKSEITLEFKWFPKAADFGAWRTVAGSAYMWLCFKNTIVRTVLATIISLFMLVTFSYPLSRKEFPAGKFLLGMVSVTMFFTGGLIPTYLNISDLGIMDTIWSLVLPGALSAFNVILLKNFFAQLPESLIEAAKIDGANDIRILFTIVIRLSMPILATLTLWQMVGNWNAWFDCLLYINDRSKYVLQIMLRELQTTVAAITEGGAGVDASQAPPSDGIIAASNLFVILPIVCVYPFLQKYFVKGITLGAVKG